MTQLRLHTQQMKQFDHKFPIDGLRGIAIGMVVLFHAFGRWPNLTPWLTEYASFWPIKYGHLGVELFFLISGYLIAQSLESSKSFFHFSFKRWLRLFPLMLLATCLILATSGLLIERPPGSPKWSDALPGLLFLHPYFFEKFFDVIVQPLEWAYWSLFVEVIFYAIFGLIYFVRKKFAVNALAAIFLLAVTYKFGIVNSGMTYSILVLKLIDACFIHFGWFYLGSSMYQHNESGKYNFGFFILILSLCIYIKMGTDFFGALMCIFIYLLFYAGVTDSLLTKLLSARWLVWAGFISYPLYLIHENALIALTIKVHRTFPVIPAVLTPLPGLIVILSAAYILALLGDIRKYIKPHEKININ